MPLNCSRCSTPLSAYNAGTMCGPCEVGARQDGPGKAESLPLTFWFRPEVRAALARWDWGTVLVAVAKAARLSQTALGDRVGLSQAHVSRLMAGRCQEPGIRTVLGIVDALGVPRLLAGLAPRGLDQRAMESDEQTATVERVERRTLGKAIVGITLAIPLAGTEPGQPVNVTRLEPDDVVADLYALDDRYGGAAVADIAVRRLRRLTHQLDQISLTPSAETRMQSVIGALATCCAWLAFDSGDERRAWKLDSEALCAAHLANDKKLQVQVLAGMSTLAKRTGKVGEAVNLAESALSILGGSDRRVQALLTMRVALGAAKRNDTRAFQKARSTAWAHIDRARPVDHPAAWFRFFDEYELSSLEAMGLMDLGEHAEAAAMLARLADGQTFVRNGAYYSAVRAQALIAAGSPDEAAAVVGQALPVLTEVTSARTMRRLAGVRRGLTPYLGDADVAECADVIDGLVGR